MHHSSCSPSISCGHLDRARAGTRRSGGSAHGPAPHERLDLMLGPPHGQSGECSVTGTGWVTGASRVQCGEARESDSSPESDSCNPRWRCDASSGLSAGPRRGSVGPRSAAARPGRTSGGGSASRRVRTRVAAVSGVGVGTGPSNAAILHVPDEHRSLTVAAVPPRVPATRSMSPRGPIPVGDRRGFPHSAGRGSLRTSEAPERSTRGWMRTARAATSCSPAGRHLRQFSDRLTLRARATRAPTGSSRARGRRFSDAHAPGVHGVRGISAAEMRLRIARGNPQVVNSPVLRRTGGPGPIWPRWPTAPTFERMQPGRRTQAPRASFAGPPRRAASLHRGETQGFRRARRRLKEPDRVGRTRRPGARGQPLRRLRRRRDSRRGRGQRGARRDARGAARQASGPADRGSALRGRPARRLPPSSHGRGGPRCRRIQRQLAASRAARAVRRERSPGKRRRPARPSVPNPSRAPHHDPLQRPGAEHRGSRRVQHPRPARAYAACGRPEESRATRAWGSVATTAARSFPRHLTSSGSRSAT